MFERFRAAFQVDALGGGEIAAGELISLLGGSSFARGLYRLVADSERGAWRARLLQTFPSFAPRSECFAYDWLGRAFVLDNTRSEGGSPAILMLEPGTGEALEIPCNIETFHDEELIEFGDAALASEFHARWLEHGGAAPQRDQCVGYRKPLFLGGDDEIHNLEVTDLDVYWTLVGQLIARVRGLDA